MVYPLRQSTAGQDLTLPPLYDDTDFKTPETGLTMANTDIKLLRDGGASADKNSGGGTHRINGCYSIVIDATDSATVGHMKISVKLAGALGIFMDCFVFEEAVYDLMFPGGATGAVTIAASGIPVGAFVNNSITAAAIAANALDGAGDWNIDKTGYSLTQAFPSNFADLSIAITSGFVNITQAAADKAWGTTARTLTANGIPVGGIANNAITAVSIAASALDGKGDWLTDKDGYTLSAVGIDSIWDENIVAAHGTADTAGLILSALTHRSVVLSTGVILDSTIGQLMDDGTAWSFSAATDSLEATANVLAGLNDITAASVWAVGTRELTSGANIALAKGVGLTGLNDLSAAEVNTQADLALTDIGLDHLVFTSVIGTDVADNSIMAKIVSSAATADWDTFVNTDDSLQSISESGGGGPTAADIADAVWDEDIEAAHGTDATAGLLLRALGANISNRSNNADLNSLLNVTDGVGIDLSFQIWEEILTGATHNVATSAGRRVREIEAGLVITAGMAQAGGVATITLAAGESATSNIFDGDRVIIVAGTGISEHGIITAYDGGTKIATMSQNWVITPDATSEYELVPADVDVETWQHETVSASATTLKPEVDIASISDDATAANNAELFFDGTGYAGGTTKLDVNIASIDAAAITAASIAANALDGKGDWNIGKTGYSISGAITTLDGLNDPTVAAITSGIWDALRSAHVGAGSFGQGVASVQGNVTGSVASVTGAVGSVTGAVGSVTADVTIDAGSVDLIWDEAQAGHVGAGSFGLFLDAVVSGASTHNAADVWSSATRILTANTNFNDVSTADVNAQMVDVLFTDTHAELAATPAANAPLADKINWSFMLNRNEIQVTATLMSLRNDADSADVATAILSDDGTTFQRDKWL